MLEFAIVGGGLSGLALAARLQGMGRSFSVFEARSRFGGRILSATSASGLRADLGPVWFWPPTQPCMTRLLSDLRLSSFPQHDAGAVLVLGHPNEEPAALRGQTVHSGARRIEGGTGAIVEALIERLPADSLHPEHVLTHVADRGDHLELRFRRGSGEAAVAARRVALAIPPRLLEEHVRFEPALGDGAVEAMRRTHTWMSAQAKAVMIYDGPPAWREAGNSGNAFVQHEQAVLSEIFDACDGNSRIAALGGFLALPPELRMRFGAGLPMLIGAQMAQMFGPGLEHGELHYQDWAEEEHTCSILDRVAPGSHPEYGDAILTRPFWGGRLFFCASETAVDNGGYMEGALDAAARVERQLMPESVAVMTTGSASNAASLAVFGEWAASQQEAAFLHYKQRLHDAMSNQQPDQLTQLAMLDAVELVLRRALAKLDELPFDMRGVPVERDRSALTPKVQAAFDGFIPKLFEAVVDFNRRSCALSNFPHEHRPSKVYTQTILQDVAAAWREFSLAANKLLLSKGQKRASSLTAMAGGERTHGESPSPQNTG